MPTKTGARATDEAAQTAPTVVMARAVGEPTLYQAVYDSLDAAQRDELARMTPFARELQLWLWSRPGPTWSHRRLALSLGIPESTVNAWFGRRGTRPEGSAYRKIQQATGWADAHLMALTGYDTPPPYTPDFHDFALERVKTWPHFDGHDRANVVEFLDDAWDVYTNRPRRPSPRKGKRKETTKSAQ